MPKEQLNITRFDGGINSKADARNIGESQSKEMVNIEATTNLAVDRKGKLRMSGGLVNKLNTHIIAFTDPDSDYILEQMKRNKGKGFFVYSQDYQLVDINGDIAEEPAYTRPTLICYFDGSSIRIWDTSSRRLLKTGILDLANINSETYDEFTLETEDSIIEPVYYVSQGALHISDGNLSNNSIGKRLSLVNELYMVDQPDEYLVREWVVTDLILPSPSSFLGGNVPIYPSDPTEPNAVGFYFSDTPVYYQDTGSGEAGQEDLIPSTLVGNIYKVGISFIYDGGAHSDIEVALYNVDLTNYTYIPTLHCSICCGADEYSRWHPSIIGFNVYLKTESETFWNRFMGVDLRSAKWTSSCVTGVNQTSSSYTHLIEVDTGNLISYWPGDLAYKRVALGAINDYSLPLVRYASEESFRALSGRDPSAEIDCLYKTAVFTGGKLYAANIKQNGIVSSDRMLKSIPRQPMVLPDYNWVDAAVNDGDEIVKLNTFADRVLQFKKKTLYIFNTTEDVDFIEVEHKGYGLDFHSASCETPIGVCFANRNGLYLYDSQKVVNLLAPDGKYLISRQDWQDFTFEEAPEYNEYVDYIKHLFMGYEPNKNKVYVFNDFGRGYTVNLSNGILSKTQDRYSHFESALDFGMSNIVTHNNLMYTAILASPLEELEPDDEPTEDLGGVYSFNVKPQDGKIDLITRDISFGVPGIQKKIYTIWITYKTDYISGSFAETPNVALKAALNGTEDFNVQFESKYTFNGGFSSDTLSAPSSVAGGGFVKVAVKPTTSISNAFSIQLWFYTPDESITPSSFEMDDISITYRIKGVR